MPIVAFTVSLRSFFALPILDLCLCICRDILISPLDSFRDLMPQCLRFAFFLLVEGSCEWRAVLGVCSIEEKFLLASLRCVSSWVEYALGRPYCQIFDMHFLVPESRKLEQLLPMRVLDEATNRIVCATEVALGLELQVGHHASFRTSYVCVVAEFVFHRAEENAASVHVGLRDEAVHVRSACFHYGRWCTYYRSPVFRSRKIAIPSIMLAAELPRNLLLGFKHPSIRMLCSGAMKK